MFVLIDYANLHPAHQTRGTVYIAEKILYTIGLRFVRTLSRVFLRFYGGWYDETVLTHQAQTLAAEIQAHFPRPVTVLEAKDGHSLSVVASMAYALEIEPHRRLCYTFRQKGTPPSLLCHHPTEAGCVTPACPLLPVQDFINSGCCTAAGCPVTVETLLHRREQKLVDTMMTADLIYTSRGEDWLVFKGLEGES